MLCRDSEEPACRGGVLPDASIGQGPGTPRQRGQKTVTVQGGGACPAVAQRKRGRAFCRHGARPGARTITNLSWEQEQKQKA